jgi:hypothetical protein
VKSAAYGAFSRITAGVGKRRLLVTLHEAHCSRRTFIFCHPERSAEGAKSRDSDRAARLRAVPRLRFASRTSARDDKYDERPYFRASLDRLEFVAADDVVDIVETVRAGLGDPVDERSTNITAPRRVSL